MKIEVGPKNFFEKCGFALKQENNSCCTVHDHACEQYGPKGAWGQILEQHAEVVAEVEVDLLRIVVRKGSSSDVKNHAAGVDPDFVPGQLGSPAEVDLLHVGEKVGIESAQFSEYLATDQHAGPRCPENISSIVVLPFIHFDRIQNPAPAKRIPQAIYESAGGTCIFESCRFGEGSDFWRDGSHFGMGV